MSKHTPTPWQLIPGREIKTAKRQSGTLWHDNGEEDGYTIGGLESILPDNAALIVRAVNSHDALVAALETALYDLEERMQKDPGWRPRSLTKLQAALKLAKG